MNEETTIAKIPAKPQVLRTVYYECVDKDGNIFDLHASRIELTPNGQCILYDDRGDPILAMGTGWQRVAAMSCMDGNYCCFERVIWAKGSRPKSNRKSVSGHVEGT